MHVVKLQKEPGPDLPPLQILMLRAAVTQKNGYCGLSPDRSPRFGYVRGKDFAARVAGEVTTWKPLDGWLRLDAETP